MKKLTVLMLLSIYVFCATAQESGAPILSISPSPLGNARGMTGVALPSSDTYSFFYNPANLGMTSNFYNVSLNFYTDKIKLAPESFPRLKSTAVATGYRFSNRGKKSIVSLGFGYSRSELELGEQVYSDTSGAQLASALNFEQYDQFSVGIGLEYYIIFNLGFSYKTAISDLGFSVLPDGSLLRMREQFSAVDYGLSFVIPVTRLLNWEKPLTIPLAGSVKPYLRMSIGYARRNLGDELKYNSETEEVPLPRTAAAGYGISAGLNIKYKKGVFKALALEWTAEAEDRLVDDGTYQGVFGDISLGENILLANGDSEVSARRGYRLELLEFFEYSAGEFEGAGITKQTTSGFGFRTKGIFKLLRNRYFKTELSFLYENFDFRYFQSKIPIDGHTTTFRGISIEIGGL